MKVYTLGLDLQIGDSFSSETDVTSGVHQGIVLGLLLFLIYINDLFAYDDYLQMTVFYIGFWRAIVIKNYCRQI
ncbi:hypothetical protein J437_LFUL019519, partial [Ladona fulva]